MGTLLNDLITRCRYDVERKAQIQQRCGVIYQDMVELHQQYEDYLESQRLLSSINEENTVRTLEYITGVINKALAQIFQSDGRRIHLEKSLYRNRYAHVNIKLTTDRGYSRDLSLQTGQGVKEVISFLFVVCLIAVRGGRRLLLMDELLSGLHLESKQVIAELMRVFCEEGFQFIMIEYGLDNLDGHSFGEIVNVEMRDGVSTVVHVDDGAYKPARYM